MSSPSRPVNIGSPRQANVFHSGSLTPTGTPDVRLWRAQYTGTPPVPNIPPRFTPGSVSSGSPGLNMPSQPELIGRAYLYPTGQNSPARPSSAGTPGSGVDSGTLDLDNLPDEDKAKVIRRHLLTREERQRGDMNSISGSYRDARFSNEDVPSDGSSTPVRSPAIQREETEAFPIPYEAPGADITHDIYKWHTDQRRQAARPRASSFHGSEGPSHPAFEHIHEPGGFRRNYVLMHANEQGGRATNNFIDFLYIYGQFAGEDLEEEDEDRLEDEEATIRAGPSEIEDSTVVDESQPLLKGRSSSRSRSRRRAASVGPHGDASVTQALLKAFVGTGVLFLGKAFSNGGLLFSTITITIVALVSLHSFLLLVRTKFVVSGSFGDIGGALYGPWMRYTILSSIVISQIGFVSAYTIFVAENLQAFVLGVTKGSMDLPVIYLILVQLIIFIPLALVRNLAKLSTTALVADAFILAGLLYIWGSEFSFIGERGFAEVQMFNPKDFPLFVGTAVFSFEGIGLVIPITDAMREPRKFPKVLTGVMITLLFLFGGAGALSYLTFGSEVQAVVLVNLDQSSKLTQSVQFLYSLAILLSIPLQFFPAVRILENGLFVRSGRQDPRVKWTKNLFRFGLVAVSTVLSWIGAADLDKFVSLIGSLACLPLCFVYPAMLHYKAVAKTPMEKIGDILLGIFGMAAMFYTTYQTIKLMAEPEATADLPRSS
ncbi:hypothetical protein AZE42_09772 [Rhizopogon vesiculosus]|uniref:Amino acid transporter transmembrane domain-containing protein n=1 Tax=Rhizopogon vesiculosus TaxID=180088 RepID=A0A1J8QDB8_9AGAM|nr:hypothetical protein AZE42_09772 [Rhizopogon vesiculosus]